MIDTIDKSIYPYQYIALTLQEVRIREEKNVENDGLWSLSLKYRVLKVHRRNFKSILVL